MALDKAEKTTDNKHYVKYHELGTQSPAILYCKTKRATRLLAMNKPRYGVNNHTITLKRAPTQ
jgi:hypothetical protein